MITEHDHDHHDHHGHEHHEHHHHESHGLKHYHDEDMQSVALSIEGDVDPEKFMPWLQDYVQKEGASILRAKGITRLQG